MQESLVGSAGQLNEAATMMVTAARGSPQQLASCSRSYNTGYGVFIQVLPALRTVTGTVTGSGCVMLTCCPLQDGMTVAGANRDHQAQQLIVGGLKGVSVVSSKLMLAAKSLHSDPTAPNAKNLLAQAARNVTEAINQLIGQ